jgi:hypothetical protein
MCVIFLIYIFKNTKKNRGAEHSSGRMCAVGCGRGGVGYVIRYFLILNASSNNAHACAASLLCMRGIRPRGVPRGIRPRGIRPRGVPPCYA